MIVFSFWILLISQSLLVSSFIGIGPWLIFQCCGPYLPHMAKKEGYFSCFTGPAALIDMIALC